MNELAIFKIVKGDSYIEQLYFNDVDNYPIDLTQYTKIEMSIRTGVTADSKQITKASTETGEITIEGDNNNIMTIKLDTFDENGGFYYRDIKFFHSNFIATYVKGKIFVIENITD